MLLASSYVVQLSPIHSPAVDPHQKHDDSNHTKHIDRGIATLFPLIVHARPRHVRKSDVYVRSLTWMSGPKFRARKVTLHISLRGTTSRDCSTLRGLSNERGATQQSTCLKRTPKCPRGIEAVDRGRHHEGVPSLSLRSLAMSGKNKSPQLQ